MNGRLPINPPAPEIGRANVVIGGTARSYHVRNFRGSLSIKTVSCGSATWQVNGRRFVANDQCLLVLNDGQEYSIDIDSHEKTTTFCLFFARGFVEDIWRAKTTAPDRLVDLGPGAEGNALHFLPCLQPQNSLVLAKIRRFQQAIAKERITFSEWEDEFIGIGASLVASQTILLGKASRLPSVKASTRLEILKRVLRGRDLLLSSTVGTVPLKVLAREACMSPYHFHRAFRQLFGITPHALLTKCRLDRAAEQLRRTEETVTGICLRNGFESLPSFTTLFHKHFGLPPIEFRRQSRRPQIRKIQ